MRITIAQLNYHIGNFAANQAKMLDAAKQAKAEGSDLVVFGELATTGYYPQDFLEFDDFIRQSDEVLEQIRLASAEHSIGILVGAPRRNPVVEGKDLFNSAFFFENGMLIAVQDKALLPTYDIFDEYRHFEPAKEFRTVMFRGQKIALCICEDIWNVGNDNPLYTVCPLDEVAQEKPDFIVNLSASPFSYSHLAERLHVIRTNVLRYNCPMFYANGAGAQTELIFDGGSVVMSANGNTYEEMPYFVECTRTYELDEVKKGERSVEQPKEKMAIIHQALLTGIRDYFQKLGFKKAILGLSGGIDSALVAVLAAQALGANNVRVILMPSQYSTDHSVTDARVLAERLGIQYDIVAIKPIYEAYMTALAAQFTATQFDVTEENLQARARGTLLMAMSNKFGNVLLNTSNKSETAVGYGTLYGDMCGGLAVIGDLYKTEVYELARYINRDEEIIPWNSIEKAPSAELRPGQKDQDSLPPYDILDKILFEYIEQKQGPKEIVAQGFEEELVRKILRMVNRNEFKRFQTPPILRISAKAFGMGRRLPIVAKYLG